MTPPPPAPWFTWLQLTWLVLQLVGLGVLAAAHYARDPDVFALLWRDPMGVKMLVTAGGALLVGVGLYLGGCVLLNRWADRGGRRRLPLYRGWMVGLAVFAFVTFYMPVVNLMTIGPAAIQIQRNLQGP